MLLSPPNPDFASSVLAAIRDIRTSIARMVRDENMDAADNAYRELVAERERAKRQAERGPRKALPKQNAKDVESKDKKEKIEKP